MMTSMNIIINNAKKTLDSQFRPVLRRFQP